LANWNLPTHYPATALFGFNERVIDSPVGGVFAFRFLLPIFRFRSQKNAVVSEKKGGVVTLMSSEKK